MDTQDTFDNFHVFIFRSFYMLFWRFALESMDEYATFGDSLENSETAKHIYRYYKKFLQVLAYNHG